MTMSTHQTTSSSREHRERREREMLHLLSKIGVTLRAKHENKVRKGSPISSRGVTKSHITVLDNFREFEFELSVANSGLRSLPEHGFEVRLSIDGQLRAKYRWKPTTETPTITMAKHPFYNSETRTWETEHHELEFGTRDVSISIRRLYRVNGRIQVDLCAYTWQWTISHDITRIIRRQEDALDRLHRRMWREREEPNPQLSLDLERHLRELKQMVDRRQIGQVDQQKLERELNFLVQVDTIGNSRVGIPARKILEGAGLPVLRWDVMKPRLELSVAGYGSKGVIIADLMATILRVNDERWRRPSPELVPAPPSQPVKRKRDADDEQAYDGVRIKQESDSEDVHDGKRVKLEPVLPALSRGSNTSISATSALRQQPASEINTTSSFLSKSFVPAGGFGNQPEPDDHTSRAAINPPPRWATVEGLFTKVDHESTIVAKIKHFLLNRKDNDLPDGAACAKLERWIARLVQKRHDPATNAQIGELLNVLVNVEGAAGETEWTNCGKARKSVDVSGLARRVLQRKDLKIFTWEEKAVWFAELARHGKAEGLFIGTCVEKALQARAKAMES